MTHHASPHPAGAQPRRRAPNCPAPVLDEMIAGILAGSDEPLSAYDVAARLRERGREMVPASIYRSLARLCSARRVRKVETLSAFRSNDVPDSLLAICLSCGRVDPVPAGAQQEALSLMLEQAGFSAKTIALEATGLCRACRERDGVGIAG